LLVRFITFVYAVACRNPNPSSSTHAIVQNDPVPGPNAPSLLPPDGWGDTEFPLVDVTANLTTLPISPNQP
jgi:hypothetical protein